MNGKTVAVLRILGAVPDVPTPEPEAPAKPTSMDGGARKTPEAPAETHGQTLMRVLSSRAADTGGSFGD